MKSLISLTAGLCLSLGLASQTFAQDAAPVASTENSVEAAIKQQFQISRPGIQLGDIKSSPISGLYSVQVLGGPLLYVTADGKHFVMGDLYEAVPGGFVNLAEKERESGRAEIMATVKRDEQIIFAPEGQPVKASITVFTDVDCYYCQKLHQEVPDLNRIGIEVRYMAFPRAGVGSESYNKIASAWCAEDQQDAMTKLKNRQAIPTNVCSGNPVAGQYNLGQQLGVSGTPAMLTDEGRLMPGYMPALRLARALGVEVEAELAAELAAKEAAQSRR